MMESLENLENLLVDKGIFISLAERQNLLCDQKIFEMLMKIGRLSSKIKRRQRQ